MGKAYTIVATTFNDQNSVCKYLENILRQTCPPQEIIISDGGSTDATVDVIQRFAQSAPVPVRVVTGGRLNIAEGYNLAIKNVTSEYVGITGIGNRYDEAFFEKLLEGMEEDTDIVYSPLRGVDSTRYARWYNRVVLNGEKGQYGSIASNHGCLINTEVFRKHGYFYEHFIYAGEDTEFYLYLKDRGVTSILAPDARVYWETPATLEEHLKQMKVYAIAQLQIDAKGQYMTFAKRLIKKGGMLALVLILAAILLWRFNNPWVWVLLFAGLAALLGRFIRKLKWMETLCDVMGMYYAVRFRKYMGEEYLVKRDAHL